MKLVSDQPRILQSRLGAFAFGVSFLLVGLALIFSSAFTYLLVSQGFVAYAHTISTLSSFGLTVGWSIIALLGISGALLSLAGAWFLRGSFSSPRRRSRAARIAGLLVPVLALAFLVGSAFAQPAFAAVGSSQTAVLSQSSCSGGGTASYTIQTDGSYYYAFDSVACALAYGGPNNAGGMTGTNAGAVIDAALAVVAANGGLLQFGTGHYFTSTQIVLPTASKSYTIQGLGQAGTAGDTQAVEIGATGNMQSLVRIASKQTLSYVSINGIAFADRGYTMSSESLVLLNQSETTRFITLNNDEFIATSSGTHYLLNMSGDEDSYLNYVVTFGASVLWYVPFGMFTVTGGLIQASPYGGFHIVAETATFNDVTFGANVTIDQAPDDGATNINFIGSYLNPPNSGTVKSNTAFFVNNAANHANGGSYTVYATFVGGKYYADTNQARYGIVAGNSPVNMVAVGAQFAQTGPTNTAFYTGSSTFSFYGIDVPPMQGVLSAPVAPSDVSVTAGTSVWTYTNSDGTDEQMILSSAGGISNMTCNGVSSYPTSVGTICLLGPNAQMAVAWATKAPVFTKIFMP